LLVFDILAWYNTVTQIVIMKLWGNKAWIYSKHVH